MKLAQSVADVLRNHVTLEVEGIDRMYLNAVIPILQPRLEFRFGRAARGGAGDGTVAAVAEAGSGSGAVSEAVTGTVPPT